MALGNVNCNLIHSWEPIDTDMVYLMQDLKTKHNKTEQRKCNFTSPEQKLMERKLM